MCQPVNHAEMSIQTVIEDDIPATQGLPPVVQTGRSPEHCSQTSIQEGILEDMYVNCMGYSINIDLNNAKSLNQGG